MDPSPPPPSTKEAKYRPTVKNAWGIKLLTGEAHAKISVRNLQATILIGRDAWGQEGKLQPVLISATVSLRKPFKDASVHDTVNGSTVHYGVLSKAILEAVEYFHAEGGASGVREGRKTTVKALMDCVCGHLTGYAMDGVPNRNPLGLKEHTPLLDRQLISSLEHTVTLPKGLLNSTTGVSRRGTIAFKSLGDEDLEHSIEDSFAMSLILHDFRVSTLIGVNPNERLAKQLVIANIEIDEWLTERDVYNELEEVVFKTIEESSFQTLESLASHIGYRIHRLIIVPTNMDFYLTFHPKPNVVYNSGNPYSGPLVNSRVRISLEKPTAVTLADAPAVELLIDVGDDMVGLDIGEGKRDLPFPLQGRLEDWMRENDPKGLRGDPTRALG